MAQPRPKPTAARKVSTSGVKALLTATALGLTIGSWAALSGQPSVDVAADVAPVVTAAPPSAPPFALSGPPIPTLVPLVAQPTLNPVASRPAPLTVAPQAPPQPPAPSLRPVNPAAAVPSISAPKPQARTRSSR